jgi:hypothetical protein
MAIFAQRTKNAAGGWHVRNRSITSGFVGSEGLAIDASIIRADANRTHGVPGEVTIEWRDPELATRAVREYLTVLDAEGPAGATLRKTSS